MKKSDPLALQLFHNDISKCISCIGETCELISRLAKMFDEIKIKHPDPNVVGFVEMHLAQISANLKEPLKAVLERQQSVCDWLQLLYGDIIPPYGLDVISNRSPADLNIAMEKWNLAGLKQLPKPEVLTQEVHDKLLKAGSSTS